MSDGSEGRVDCIRREQEREREREREEAQSAQAPKQTTCFIDDFQ